jgi:2-dehydro-3-deoxyphosphooctonate aldolase (KDO 8-P synthase)
VRTRVVDVAGVKIGGGNPLVLIAGPCVIEDPKQCVDIARQVKAAADSVGVPLIFKASYDKANRTSVDSFRGIGMKAGLETLAAIKREVKVPVLTDVHEPAQCERVAEVADVLQIPAFLCRQTDLLIAAGRTGRAVNVKKGQLLAPGDMRNVVEKIKSTDNEDILLTERGTFFGYNYLVNDMRALPAMRMLGFPVVFDATHSVQTPGGMGARSGGERQFMPALARAAVAVGVDALFMETHPEPEKALSDGPNMVRVSELAPLLRVLKRLYEEVHAVVEAETFEARAPVNSGMTLVNLGPPPMSR